MNAVSFYSLCYGAIYKRQYTDKTLTFSKSTYMRASGASELRNFSHFHVLKLLFLSIFCLYFRYLVGTNDMLVGLHVPPKFRKIMGGGGGELPPSGYASGYNKRQYTDKTLTLRESMYMWASGASELRNFFHFHILKLLFLSIFCWYFRYSVGTNDMLVGLNVPTKLRKSIIGGGGALLHYCPPAPSGYANASIVNNAML